MKVKGNEGFIKHSTSRSSLFMRRTKLEKEIIARGLRVTPPVHPLTLKSSPLKMKGYKRCPCGSGKLLKNCCKAAFIDRKTGSTSFVNRKTGLVEMAKKK